ncbi:metallophosphoesterase family protein [Ktedonobacter racemifer]|uniref:Metallophosphoesterase n=1 Tax=Ktedonobacter racemifer DSM 44963 TaxID=485913 RepID=D6U4M0_KTERA|nr:metallophosphoesterase family protein [Ktedonobacter racemifer]EFH81450.1 metallophosphoesterase [Ktedonobacter racemifer DSM 44963]
MRLAILSDIHGNSIALDAVLADIQKQGGVDGYWILGDFSALGHDPVGVLEQVTALPNASFTRGNTDRYIVTGERPGPTLEEAQTQPHLVARLAELSANFAWTQGFIQARGWWDWLAELPLEVGLTLPNGTRVLGVHAAPGLDDGPGIHPTLSEEELRKALAPAKADLVIVGHTHFPLERRVGNVHVLNLGSVSNPIIPSLQASYALLNTNANSYQLQQRFVDYDHQAVIEAIQKVSHPAEKFLTQFMRGEKISPWAQM